MPIYSFLPLSLPPLAGADRQRERSTTHENVLSLFQQSVLLFGVSVPSASCSSWPTFHESEDTCTNQHTEVYLHSANPIIRTCTYDQHAAAACLRSECPRASVQFSPPECAYVRFTPMAGASGGIEDE